jgi:hypothetical protein
VTKKEMEKIDPSTQRPIIGEDGQPVREEVEVRFARFKVVSVFDVSQTEGEPLPELAEPLTGDVERYELFMDSLQAVSPLPIAFEELPPDTDGACHFGDRISVRAGMSQVQTVSAVIHEITHAKLHDLEVITESGEQAKDRRTREVEAESVSFTVCAAWGIQTGANSFGYIADWSKGREIKELNASLDTIRRTAAELISGIEKHYHALAKERGIDLSAGEPGAEQSYNESAKVEETPAISAQAAHPSSTSAAGEHLQGVAAEPNPPETDVSALIAAYARSAEVSDPPRVGAGALMTPLFDNMNYNRAGKKIRVTVEEPAGKYRLFSHDENGGKNLYFLTASGRVERVSSYFSDDWDETNHKYVSHRPTEAELDAALPRIAEWFGRDMADPAKWARYQDAAVLNRLDECETHNIPVRRLREEESHARQAAEEQAWATKQREKQEKYDARVDEIAGAVASGKTITVGYSEDEHDGRNPVLDLFKLYGIDLPLRTQGWVNTGLAEITAGSYRYYKSKHKGDSSAFGGYLRKLREAIHLAPIEQKRGGESADNLVIGEDEEVRITFDQGGAPIMLEPESVKAPVHMALDLSLPDPTVTAAAMNEYGYTEPDMYPLRLERALELYSTDHPIYILFPDNTEMIALDMDDIHSYDSHNMLGITKTDWETSPVRAAQMAVAEGAEGSREADLLFGDDSKFGIYQIKDGIEEARDFRFASIRELEALGLSPNRANYELVYTGRLDIHDTLTNKHRIYGAFQHGNPECPPDFAGRSVSVSDVIVLQWKGEVSAHYVDSAGFKELPSFTGSERPQPLESHRETEKREAESAPTFSQVGKSFKPPSPAVADLEAEVKAGRSISVMEARAVSAERRPPAGKERPPLLARLAEAKEIAARRNALPAAKNRNEREI